MLFKRLARQRISAAIVLLLASVMITFICVCSKDEPNEPTTHVSTLTIMIYNYDLVIYEV